MNALNRILLCTVYVVNNSHWAGQQTSLIVNRLDKAYQQLQHYLFNTFQLFSLSYLQDIHPDAKAYSQGCRDQEILAPCKISFKLLFLRLTYLKFTVYWT